MLYNQKKHLNKKIILPGELFFSVEPYIISTILGSCISVTLFNKKYKFGGMNHYVLDKPANADVKDNKFGINSIINLLKKMFAVDSDVKNIEAKIFGGGNVVSLLTGVEIGRNNVLIAKKILNEYSIPIVNEYINNDFGLKVHFNNTNHSVNVSKINRTTPTETKELNSLIQSSNKIVKNSKILIYSSDFMFKNYLIKWLLTKKHTCYFLINDLEILIKELKKNNDLNNCLLIADSNLITSDLYEKINPALISNNFKIYINKKNNEIIYFKDAVALYASDYNAFNFQTYFNKKIEI